MFFESTIRSNKDRAFSAGLLLVLFALIADCSTYILEVIHAPVIDLYFTNYVAHIMNVWIMVAYSYYLFYMIEERSSIRMIFPKITTAYAIALTVFDTVITFTGDLFLIENGVYVHGELYDLYVVLSNIPLLYALFNVILYSKILQGRNTVLMSSYLLFPLIVDFVVLLLNGPDLSYVTTVLTALIIYILLQSNSMEEATLREKVLLEVSNTDTLTGLQNRRSCDEYIQSLLTQDVDVGIAFFDLNGLKFTNDNISHAAGDNLLIEFSALLCSCFRAKEVYRISGDEFVVIALNIPTSAFNRRIRRLRTLIDQKNDIASIGFVHGSSSDIFTLIHQAEKLMYEDKIRCHTLHPEWKREV